MDLAARRERAELVNCELQKMYPRARCVLNYSNPWELVVAVQLSAQCTDAQVNKVTPALFARYPQLVDYVHARASDFERDIFSTGFYRNKARNILAAARMVSERFGGEVPRTMGELLELPGVARKTANVVLGNAYGVIDGIAVDTHVGRLAQVLGLTRAKMPEKIEQDLMRLLPREEWFVFTYRLIEYGREYCVARRHDHARCPLTPLLQDNAGIK